MTESEKQALAIYEGIAATSNHRPVAFHSVEQMLRETIAWKENNSALAALGRAEPPVLLAFLDHCFDAETVAGRLGSTLAPRIRWRNRLHGPHVFSDPGTRFAPIARAADR